MIHELKTWPEPYDEIVDGTKTFEYRRNDDRHFRQGDVLILKEWSPGTKEYTGREATALVGFVICGYDPDSYGVPQDYAVLSITRVWTGPGMAGWITPAVNDEGETVDEPDWTYYRAATIREMEYAEEGGARP